MDNFKKAETHVVAGERKYNYIKFFLKTSILKSLIFNIRYFGIKGLLFPVVIGKKVELKHLKGNVIVEPFKSFSVKIGMNDMGHFPINSTYCVFDNLGTVIFRGKANLGVGTAISNHGILDFGATLNITAKCCIICYNSIKIGNDCLISWNTQLTDRDGHKIKENGIVTNNDEPIEIGNHVWICNGVSIYKGSCITNNVVVAAHSIIKHKIDKENVVVGNLGKIIKENIDWEI